MDSARQLFLLLGAVIYLLTEIRIISYIPLKTEGSKLILFQLVGKNPQARVVEQS